jgi:hypothetical protein
VASHWYGSRALISLRNRRRIRYWLALAADVVPVLAVVVAILAVASTLGAGLLPARVGELVRLLVWGDGSRP